MLQVRVIKDAAGYVLTSEESVQGGGGRTRGEELMKDDNDKEIRLSEAEKYMRFVQDILEESVTVDRDWFKVEVSLHQGWLSAPLYLQ